MILRDSCNNPCVGGYNLCVRYPWLLVRDETSEFFGIIWMTARWHCS